ncbi:T6SS immunity protein Tli4 family protein [Roseateles koreensis]|uniref:T6SS immunity protein Tli4 family protein n=1 Tax=Roseateles koreensis TaxID=2987526 RepID=A0ABT5KW41_9BURK|nr:T6SS immunity protein Tli4 family protein [Roseateles koreensis]MDC8787153.1 T6SS immunity protein Tli4 family protein [Roseateles koreensis]
MKRWKGLLVGALVATLSYALLPTSTVLTEKEMQKIEQLTTQMQTHCVGRYLIDLPQGFVLSSDTEAGFFIGLDADHDLLRIVNIQQGLGDQQFQGYVTKKIAKWDELNKYAQPDQHKTNLARVVPYGAETLAQTWSTYSGETVDLSYLGFRDGIAYTLTRTANSTPERIAEGTTRLLDLSRRISRVSDPLKAGKGTCIDELLIAGQYDEEKLDIYFWHPKYPDLEVKINFAAIQEDEEDDIFARARKASSYLNVIDPKLHDRRYDFFGMKANENGFKSPSEIDNGKTNYAYQMETRRANGSVRMPHIHVVMKFAEYKNGKKTGSDFSQAEALALWEAIIKTLRPRPGAV